MATSLTISGITARLPWTFESVQTWANSSNSYAFGYTKSLTNGTGANQADLLYVVQSTLSASSSTNVDLAGSATDVFGSTITFARVKAIYFELTTATTATSVAIGGASSNGFANWISSAGTFGTDQPKVVVRNGGVFLLVAPDATAYAVTAGTGDILKLTNQDGSNVATYNLAIVGASA